MSAAYKNKQAIYRIYTGNGSHSLWFLEVEVSTQHITRDMIGNGDGKHLKSYDNREQAKKAIEEHSKPYRQYTVFE